MRPPPKEAEYARVEAVEAVEVEASMRPPPKEAEYDPCPTTASASACFNEAASQRGGIRTASKPLWVPGLPGGTRAVGLEPVCEAR